DAVMMVVSAHHRPKLDEALPTAKFPVVVSAAVAGAQVRWKKPPLEVEKEIAPEGAIPGIDP
ncbi:hypothetical protein, partial [Sphingomonas sp. JC676]|uniref:hypothetical protein n=1 Tax=Sphingomonas sp. JC676 TaxID=2768065 RepID=UPI001CA71D9C